MLRSLRLESVEVHEGVIEDSHQNVLELLTPWKPFEFLNYQELHTKLIYCTQN